MTISIAMATYNGASYLDAQLASLAGQTRVPDELVVCDDRSDDHSVDIIERFAQNAPFAVRVIRNQTRLGVLRNFEKAIGLAQGKYIFLSDQDDIWLSDKISLVMQEFESHPSCLVILNDKYIVGNDLRPGEATMLRNIRGFGSPDSNFVAGCTSAFRREWFSIALPIPPGPPAHDSWLVGLAHRLSAVRIMEKPLQLYRRHDQNVSQNAYSDNKLVGWRQRLREEIASLADKPASRADTRQSFLSWHEAERDRISQRQSELIALGYGERATRALEDLERVIHFGHRRMQFAQSPRRRRIFPVAAMWAKGGYKLFSGWKSALKDVVQ